MGTLGYTWGHVGAHEDCATTRAATLVSASPQGANERHGAKPQAGLQGH